MRPIVTLTSDFGLEDGYVASMKGVILGLCPDARIVDVSHLVPPQDIRAGAFLLAGVYRDFPPGTIHVAVVDPGVGTSRRALAVKAGGYFFIGPDNGLFSRVLEREAGFEARSLENPDLWRHPVSSTFHGRDIFAPVAAHLASGVPFESLGPPCRPHIAPWSSPARSDGELSGEIVSIDRFGNAITNISRSDLKDFAPDRMCRIEVKGLTISGVVETYGQIPPGEPAALIGSGGYLEVAVNRGSAAQGFGIRPGDPVSVRRSQPV